MRTVIMLLVVFAISTPSFAEGAFWQGQLPFSMGTSSDAAKPSLEFGGGLGVDAFLWHVGPFMLGLGGGLYGTLPFKTGNAAVSVKPYTLYSEERLSIAYILSGPTFSIIPTLGLKSVIGAAIFNRQVQKSASTSIDLLLALGPTMSVFYWLKQLGFGLAYSMSYGTKGLRQHVDLSFVVSIPVSRG